MSTVCVVQARMGSTRLPGKVLADLGGRSMLELLVERLQRGSLGEVVVATSVLRADDAVAQLATRLGVSVVRGPEQDVLARFEMAVDAHRPDHVVRITADCPLTDPELIAKSIEKHLELEADYTSNTLARTYPDGLDVEVIRASALAAAAHEATDADEREHVTPFVYRRPDRFHLATVCVDDRLGEERWTIDTADDLDRLRSIVGALDDPVMASWRDVLAIAGRRPAPPRGTLLLEPVCWPGVEFRRGWDAIVDERVVGSVGAVVIDPGRGRLTYEGAPEYRVNALALASRWLHADKQITSLLD